MTRPEPLLSVKNLSVSFANDAGTVKAVDGLSFAVEPGQCVAIVGESGSGKSVTAMSILGLTRFSGGNLTSGSIDFRRRDGTRVDLASAPGRTLRDVRGNEIAMIFQEPMTALNPVYPIGEQIAEAIRAHRDVSRAEADAEALALIERVRIPEPARRFTQFPHELSGGMRQRVVIAMALACSPSLLIADEPTTALDVTIQAQILHLVRTIAAETGMAMLFITHDMGVVAEIADAVVVMRHGLKVEEAEVGRFFTAPAEAYSQALLAAVPRLGTVPERQMPTDAPLLAVKNLVTQFPVRKGILSRHVANVHAVDDVSFSLTRGETLALVGESGCGKSTTGRSILRLVDAKAGSVQLEGDDILTLDENRLRQRLCIARALTLSPKLIVADEAVSALDVSIQKQVVDLMLELQEELALSYLFISHDMGVVERMSHRVAVMYMGRIVEIGPRAAVFGNPRHDYTKALLAAVPTADPSRRRRDAPKNVPLKSPIHPVGYTAAAPCYDTVGDGHLVLAS
ncbi:ABC transporter ATP-binding protein [Devosia sp.]|uniref:dipeptide ABC transporter ATP-binding protein n=1 Tax=Devosia sp. TaxID=1871048 RepID=UPI001AC54144|nr:ABC transporter ATP-binding protein [Devosia sp.]MBN9333929.1 ABC transporter ATP-binding protein [Devosia sp.]